MKYLNSVFLCFILFCLVAAPAQGKTTDEEVWGLHVEMTDGKVTSFVLLEQPMVHFTNGLMTASIPNFSVEISNVKRWYFKDFVKEGINDIAYSNLQVSYNNSIMMFEGENLTGSQVLVYDVQGRTVTPHVGKSANRVVVSLESMPAGNYIVVFNNNSYKISKK